MQVGKTKSTVNKRILIAQPHNLGDVVCCLPLAGAIKQAWPRAQVFFAARPYAKALVEACSHVDGYLDSTQVQLNEHLLHDLRADVFLNPFRNTPLAVSAKRARIPIRVGNFRRLSTARYCNKFVYFGRSSSGLHEAQLNLKELSAIGLRSDYSASEVYSLYGLDRVQALPAELARELEDPRFKLIFHIKSNGNGREWPSEHFFELAKRLPQDKVRIFVTGVATDGAWIRKHCPQLLGLPHVKDVTGRMDLGEFIAFIARADGLLAAGTGPLHLSAALGKRTLGLFPPLAGIGLVRWGPLGVYADSLSLPSPCTVGLKTCGQRAMDRGSCECMFKIVPAQVADRLLQWLPERAVAT